MLTLIKQFPGKKAQSLPHSSKSHYVLASHSDSLLPGTNFLLSYFSITAIKHINKEIDRRKSLFEVYGFRGLGFMPLMAGGTCQQWSRHDAGTVATSSRKTQPQATGNSVSFYNFKA